MVAQSIRASASELCPEFETQSTQYFLSIPFTLHCINSVSRLNSISVYKLQWQISKNSYVLVGKTRGNKMSNLSPLRFVHLNRSKDCFIKCRFLFWRQLPVQHRIVNNWFLIQHYFLHFCNTLPGFLLHLLIVICFCKINKSLPRTGKFFLKI